jgi:topoisomerase-4 subunit A
MLFASSGKFFTLEAGKLPGGRGHGEPVRLMADLEASDQIVALFVHKEGRKLLVAASDGSGFIVPEDECIANTRKGKQVLNVKLPVEAQVCTIIADNADHIAAIGENRKLLIFKRAEVPEMTRGKGVRLQKYKDGGLSDAVGFNLKEGLQWIDASARTFNVTDLRDWIGERAQAGRLPPKGFPRANKFG